MKKIFLVLVLFLFGCQGGIPSLVNRNWSEFIPKEKQKKEIQAGLPKDFDFVKENFSKKCHWENFVRVIDGDTIVVGKNKHVRFVGIDTPESKDERKPVQRGALEASEKTKNLLKYSKKVCLISDPIGDKIDKYGRTLAYIFTESGVDVNAELLLSGYARGYFYFPFSRRKEFEAYQQTAKNSSLGLWKKK